MKKLRINMVLRLTWIIFLSSVLVASCDVWSNKDTQNNRGPQPKAGNSSGIDTENIPDKVIMFTEIAPAATRSACDVNASGEITAVDALQVINYLNAADRADGGMEAAPNLDVNGDSRVSAIDALQIINALNMQSASGSDSAAVLRQCPPVDARHEIAVRRSEVPCDGDADLNDPDLVPFCDGRFSLSIPIAPLGLSIRYSTREGFTKALGPHWHFADDVVFSSESNSSASLERIENGVSRIAYSAVPNQSNAFQPADIRRRNTHQSVTRSSSSSSILTAAHRSGRGVTEFERRSGDTYYRLRSVKQSPQVTTKKIHRDSDGDVSVIDLPLGERIRYTYEGVGDAKRLKEVAAEVCSIQQSTLMTNIAPASRCSAGSHKALFSYTESGYLSQILFGINEWTFGYMGDRLASYSDGSTAITDVIHDRSGHYAASMSWTKDLDQVLGYQFVQYGTSRVQVQTGTAAKAFAFDDNKRTTAIFSVDGEGRKLASTEIELERDQLGRVTRRTTLDDTTTNQYVDNQSSRLLSTVDPTGVTTTYSYVQKNGSYYATKIEKTGSSGTSQATTLCYNSFGQVEYKVVGSANCPSPQGSDLPGEKFTYDSNGYHIKTETMGGKVLFDRTVDRMGRPTATRDLLMGATNISYNGAFPSSITTPTNQQVSFAVARQPGNTQVTASLSTGGQVRSTIALSYEESANSAASSVTIDPQGSGNEVQFRNETRFVSEGEGLALTNAVTRRASPNFGNVGVRTDSRRKTESRNPNRGAGGGAGNILASVLDNRYSSGTGANQCVPGPENPYDETDPPDEDPDEEPHCGNERYEPGLDEQCDPPSPNGSGSCDNDCQCKPGFSPDEEGGCTEDEPIDQPTGKCSEAYPRGVNSRDLPNKCNWCQSDNLQITQYHKCERCDEVNSIDSDDFRNVNHGFNATKLISINCPSPCGNGQLDSGEECDGGLDGSVAFCKDDCTCEEGAQAVDGANLCKKCPSVAGSTKTVMCTQATSATNYTCCEPQPAEECDANMTMCYSCASVNQPCSAERRCCATGVTCRNYPASPTGMRCTAAGPGPSCTRRLGQSCTGSASSCCAQGVCDSGVCRTPVVAAAQIDITQMPHCSKNHSLSSVGNGQAAKSFYFSGTCSGGSIIDIASSGDWSAVPTTTLCRGGTFSINTSLNNIATASGVITVTLNAFSGENPSDFAMVKYVGRDNGNAASAGCTRACHVVDLQGTLPNPITESVLSQVCPE